MDALREEAARRGWTFVERDDSMVALYDRQYDRRSWWEPLTQPPRAKGARDVITGTHRGRPFVAATFDTVYQGQHQPERAIWVAAPAPHPMLSIHRVAGTQNALNRSIGLGGVQTGNVEFDRRFEVLSEDERFAHAVLSPQLQEFLLTDPRSFPGRLPARRVSGRARPCAGPSQSGRTRGGARSALRHPGSHTGVVLKNRSPRGPVFQRHRLRGLVLHRRCRAVVGRGSHGRRPPRWGSGATMVTGGPVAEDVGRAEHRPERGRWRPPPTFGPASSRHVMSAHTDTEGGHDPRERPDHRHRRGRHRGTRGRP